IGGLLTIEAQPAASLYLPTQEPDGVDRGAAVRRMAAKGRSTRSWHPPTPLSRTRVFGPSRERAGGLPGAGFQPSSQIPACRRRGGGPSPPCPHQAAIADPRRCRGVPVIGDQRQAYRLAHVAENMAELQVRRLPMLNHDKRLVGIVSLGDLATHSSLPKTSEALHGISQPGGQYNQSRAA